MFMTLLILGLLIFLGVHSISIFAPGWRTSQIERRGESAFKAAYALLSLASFALLIYGYGVARQSLVVLYTPPTFTRHIALLLMLPVFPLLFAAYLPGRIKVAAKHPMLLAVKLWALAHLLVNGTLHDAILFGAFLVWAVADRISVKRRTVARAVPGAPPSPMNDVIAVVGGLAAYAVFVLWAHLKLIGVSPLG